jgi:hypothetical protein
MTPSALTSRTANSRVELTLCHRQRVHCFECRTDSRRRFEVYVNQSKSPAEAEYPLEIVETRPEVVPLQIDSLLNGQYCSPLPLAASHSPKLAPTACAKDYTCRTTIRTYIVSERIAQ